MEHEVLRIVQEVVELKGAEIGLATPLEQIGWDSLSVLSFMSKCDSAFGIILDSDSLSRALTVGQLVELARKSGGD